MKLRSASLLFRASVYTAYAFLVWSALIVFGATNVETRVMLGKFAAAVVIASALSFVLSAFWRKRSAYGFEEYLFSALGRTGVALVCAFVGLASLPQSARRAFAALTLVGYFATAPLHVWASLLPEEPSCKR